MKKTLKYCAFLLVAALALSCSKSEKGGKGYESYALIVQMTKNYTAFPKDAEGHSANPKLENLYRDVFQDMEKFFANSSSKWVVEFDTKNGEKTLEAKDEEAKKKLEDLVSAFNAWLDKNYAASLADHSAYGTGKFEIAYTATLSRSQKKNIAPVQTLKAAYSN